MRTTTFAERLVATAAALDPSPSDRVVLARASAKTAVDFLEAGTPDIPAARAFLRDALAQLSKVERR